MAKPAKSPDPNPWIDVTWDEMSPALQMLVHALHKAGFSGSVKLRLEVLRADRSEQPVELITRTAEADLRDQTSSVPPPIDFHL